MPSAVAAKSFALASLVLIVSAIPARAQGPSSDGKLLPEGVDTFTVSAAGEVLGKGIIARSRLSGDQWLQVYSWRFFGAGYAIDSVFSDGTSLKSLRQVRVVDDSIFDIVFRGDSAHVVMRQAEDPHPSLRSSKALMAGVYSSTALDAIVSGLPLEQDYMTQLKFYYPPPSERGIVTIFLRVLGSEPVTDRTGKERDAWVVATGTPSGGTVYWVDKATRSVLQFDTRQSGTLLEFRR